MILHKEDLKTGTRKFHSNSILDVNMFLIVNLFLIANLRHDSH